MTVFNEMMIDNMSKVFVFFGQEMDRNERTSFHLTASSGSVC